MAPDLTNNWSNSSNQNIHVCSSNSHKVEPGQEVLESIAIIGLSLRFPDDATSAELFWDMLMEGRCASRDFPKSRMNLKAFYDQNTDRLGSVPLHGGHFVQEDIAAFDAPFFSITPAEAAAMDPLQRGLLETSYRAFENAGISLETLHGSNTSVHIGCFNTDYTSIASKDPDQMPKYTGTGGAASILSNRLSWFFDLNGPSLTIDTACSSSMVALDVACQGLRNGQSDMGLVGGSNLMYSVDMTIALSNLGFLSHNSRCYSFDHRANGYARGEGFGAIILKRVGDAIRDRDTIRAVIRSTGSNQDGHTPGITLPSKDSQAKLILETYEKAGLDMRTTNYFEAHGTGTPVGDPIEINAIGSAFKNHRHGNEPLYIGAVKSNIGHLEGASGMAGLIKTVLVLEKGIIPPNANFEQVNPSIDAEFTDVQFPLKSTTWPVDGLRRASINAFGFGGTNSHAVIDDAYNYLRLRDLPGHHATIQKTIPTKTLDNHLWSYFQNSSQSMSKTSPDNTRVRAKLIVWSATDERGLSRLTTAYNQYFNRLSLNSGERTLYLDTLAYTLNTRRTSLSWKSFVIADSIEKLQNTTWSKPTRSTIGPKLTFVFTGQGAQWHAMGRELLTYPIFRSSLDSAQAYFEELGSEWSLLDELSKDEKVTNIHEPQLSQPLCTALQIALIDLLQTIGVTPSAVVGHSSGEIAAAYCAGGLSRQSAWKVAYYRGALASVLVANNSTRQTMMSVGLSEDQLVPYLQKVAHHQLTVSCVNSPRNVTVSGNELQLNTLKLLLEEDRVFARKLRVDLAYHSPQMNEIAVEYLALIKNLEKNDSVVGNITFVSSVTGCVASADQLCQGEYWVRNMISKVRFKEALERMCFQPAKELQRKLDLSHRNVLITNDILEVGPHSALQGPIRDILRSLTRGKEINYFSALIRDRSALETILEAVGQLYCLGYPVSLQHANQSIENGSHGRQRILTDLPEYPFDHSQTYWHESRLSTGYRFRQHPFVDLLGSQVPDWNPLEARWRNILRVSEIPWVADHQVNGSILFPAAGMLVMAIEAARQVSENQAIVGYELKDITFHSPINMSLNPNGIETQFCLRPLRDKLDKENAWSEFRLYVYEEGQWSNTCRGTIRVECKASATEVDGGLEIKKMKQHFSKIHQNANDSCAKVADARYIYHRLKESGLDYGPAFQLLKQLHYSSNIEATAELRLSSERMGVGSTIHPTSLDGLFQLTFVALTKGGTNSMPTTVATRMNRLWISSTGLCNSSADWILAHAKTTVKSYRTAESSISAIDANRSLKIQIDGFESTAISGSEDSTQIESAAKQMFYNIEWKPDLDLLSPQQIVDYCEDARVSKSNPECFYQDLAFLLFSFIQKSLAELENGHHSALYLQNYIAWMQLQVEKFSAGSLPDSHFEWKTLSQDSAYIDSVCERLKSYNRQGELYVKVGQNLTKILSGEVDPLNLLFTDDLVKDFYEEVNLNAHCFDTFGSYLDALVHKNPKMKVLEVGAGTGATSSLILDILMSHKKRDSGAPRYTQYDFTDISISFFEKAQEAFGKYPRMRFLTLDVEIDPTKQDFEADSYDLIIAANVLHATKDLNVTLQNIRKLLKANGKLVLVEIVRPELLRAGFVFGLLPGWWLGTEDYRSMSACITEDRWHHVLTQTGFSGVDLNFQDYENEVCHGFSILVSTATVASSSPPMILQTYVIAQTDSEFHQNRGKDIKAGLEESGSAICEVLSLQEIVSSKRDLREKCCIVLEESDRSVLQNLDPGTFSALKSVLLSSKAVLWITDSKENPMTPDHGMAQGLTRVLRTENFNSNLVTLALEASERPMDQKCRSITRAFRCMMLGPDDNRHEPEYVEQRRMLHISRLVQASYLDQDVHIKTSQQQIRIQEVKKGPPLRLSIGTPGLLDTFQFIEDTASTQPLAAGEIEVEVKAVGLNFLDCLVALGRVSAMSLGSECAGVVSAVGENCQLKPGDRVSVCSLDVFRTHARCMDDCAIKIPDDLSYNEAAAVPIAFTTVYYGLCEVARMVKGETILIHSGAGGTGQIAIQIAQHFDLEIFTTVGSNVKKQLLVDTYNIPESHILYSRDLSFAKGIKRLTQGRGVDIILNSLAGEGLVASWECMAPYGRFIEIGKKDIHSHGKLPMFPFAANVSFSAIDVGFEPHNRPPIIRRSLENAMAFLATKKIHVAHPLHVFKMSEVETAFRLLQSGKSSGKIVIEFDQEVEIPMALKPKSAYCFDANATYLISGGLGGLGRSIAGWMVGRGARNLLLLSRSGPGEKAKGLLEELRLKGAQVKTPICDVTDATSLIRVLEDHKETMPPIKGCIQGSMVLRDATFETMTYTDWAECVAPKVQGSWNLHATLPKGMDFFILLSSACGVFGNGGQANYAAGNAYQDALARYRVAQGERGVALDIGALLSEGFLAENGGSLNRSIRTGILPPMSEAELFALIDHYCDPSLNIIQPLKCQAMVGIETPANIQAKGMEEPYWMHQPLFRHLYQIDSTAGASTATGEQALDFASLFAAAATLSEAGQIVSEALIKKLSKILGMQQEDMDSTKPMASYGVDSLVAVELRNWFTRALSAEIAIFEILGEPSISAVGNTVAGKSQYRQASWVD